jgi:hypothetical protein
MAVTQAYFVAPSDDISGMLAKIHSQDAVEDFMKRLRHWDGYGDID